MAVSKARPTFELDKDHISCTICLDVFKDPRILSCLHTFCCRCLQNYIDKQPDACKTRGFSCPICREFVQVPNPTAGWAGQMKLDFRVKSMTGSVKCDHKDSEEETYYLPEAEPCVDRCDVSSEISTFTILNTIDAGNNTANGTYNTIMFIGDIVVLNQEGIDVVVVCFNDYIKALWYNPIEESEMDSLLQLNCSSLRMTKINESQIAVTGVCGGGLNQLFNVLVTIINIRPQLSIEKENCNLKSTLSNSCITMIKSKTSQTETRLLIGYDARLYVIDMHGKIHKSLTVDAAGNKLIASANYMTTTPSGNIVISDHVGKCVVCITLEREVLWKYPVKNPQGVHCDEHSNVFIADRYNKKVIVLSPEGQFVKDVLTKDDHLTQPVGLYYDRYKTRLYVCECNNLIKIFKRKS